MAAPKRCKILIVGAGISGLAAADYLINEFDIEDVIILEGLDRIGGRICPLPYENGVLEMGAEWIHGCANPLFKLAKSLGALASQQNGVQRYDGDRNLFYIPNHGLVDTQCTKQLAKMQTFIDDSAENVESPRFRSLGDIFDKVYANYLKNFPNALDSRYSEAMFNHIKKVESTVNGGPNLNAIGVTHYSEFEEIRGDENYELGPFGYKTILDYFANRIPQEALIFNKEVVKINYKDFAPVELRLADGEIYHADHVIVTSSLGYLKKNVEALFSPTLPDDKMSVIKTLGYGNLGKVHLIYEAPFWPENVENINILPHYNEESKKVLDDNDLSKIFVWLEPKPYFKNILVAFINDEYIKVMESASEEDLSNAVTELLKSCFNVDVPKPSKIIKYWVYGAAFYQILAPQIMVPSNKSPSSQGRSSKIDIVCQTK